ncbi:tumor necrosis factor receptor superfamily member 14 isoform 2-T2 [Erethizon dorsatum]
MGALPAWGPRSWHPVPEANTLRLALCLLLLGSPQRTPAQPACREEEFPAGSECCPKCNPGFHVKRVCSEVTGTECSPCPAGTYTAHPNGLRQCLRCRDCEPGTSSQDTLCADCPLGTFSPNGTLDQCLPWTRCSGWFQRETEPGTSSKDVTCSLSGVSVLLSCLVIASVLALAGLLPAIWIWKKRKRSLGHGAPMTITTQGQRQGRAEEPTDTEVLQPWPDVTTVAVEETAPVFRGKDPHR